MIYGWIGGLLEVSLFLLAFGNLISFSDSLQQVDPLVSYWLGFTVLTGYWEIVYLTNRDEINNYSNYLVKENKSVWTSEYPLTMVLPWNLSKLFYAEYGAWADREYKSFKDNWSFTVEGSHCTICAFFSLLALWSIICGNYINFLMALCVGMGSQFMNSLLYMAEYTLQTHDRNNVNYNSKDFPTGEYLLDRPFMYINYLWLLFPAYAILTNVEF